jgi:hypothetical protein
MESTDDEGERMTRRWIADKLLDTSTPAGPSDWVVQCPRCGELFEVESDTMPDSDPPEGLVILAGHDVLDLTGTMPEPVPCHGTGAFAIGLGRKSDIDGVGARAARIGRR